MSHTELHQQKIQILGRLIKESSLTLEEALLLLQEEEEEVVASTPQPFQGFPQQGTNPYYGSTFTVPLTGTISSLSTGTYNITNTTTSLTQQVLGELEKAIEDADL